MPADELPRRLQAERLAVEVLGKGCAVVDVEGDASCAVVIFSHGLAAFVGDVDESGGLSLDRPWAADARLPQYAIGITKSGARWLDRASGCRAYQPCRAPARDSVRRGAAEIKADGPWPGLVVASIARYYRRQALEPSVRGFLAILEKQFDRSDAYV